MSSIDLTLFCKILDEKFTVGKNRGAADFFSVSPTTIYRWRSGKADIPKKHVNRFYELKNLNNDEVSSKDVLNFCVDSFGDRGWAKKASVLLGVHYSTVWRWGTGRSKMPREFYRKFFEFKKKIGDGRSVV